MSSRRSLLLPSPTSSAPCPQTNQRLAASHVSVHLQHLKADQVPRHIAHGVFKSIHLYVCPTHLAFAVRLRRDLMLANEVGEHLHCRLWRGPYDGRAIGKSLKNDEAFEPRHTPQQYSNGDQAHMTRQRKRRTRAHRS